MEIRFHSKSTKVKQLVEAICQSISQGEFKEGERLPSINAMSETYQVARDTIFKAFQELKMSGVIQASPTKGYYVTSSINHILVMLDIFSPYKNVLYNAMSENLGENDRMDLFFHHYNEAHFNMIIKNSIGKYNKYIVMSLHNEKYSEVLDLIDRRNLLLLDFGKFEKSDFSYVCQGFDTTLYDCLNSATRLFQKYRRLNFIFPKDSQHPRGGIRFFFHYCDENHIGSSLLEDRPMEEDDIRPGEAYLMVSHQDMIEAVKICRKRNLVLGKDVGIVTFNDAPMLEVIDNGISVISTDFKKMGMLAGKFITDSETIQAYVPTKLIVRGSL